jgi:hypothetical protein
VRRFEHGQQPSGAELVVPVEDDYRLAAELGLDLR